MATFKNAMLGGVVVFFSACGWFDREGEKMRSMPAGMHEFKVTDPVPICGRWRSNMPSYRNPVAYQRYANARRYWRSKREYEFSRDELQGILDDVQFAADNEDWGAVALLSHFYIYGLGHLDQNKVLERDTEKAIQFMQRAVAAGQAWGYYDLGVAYSEGYRGVVKDHKIAWAYFRKAAELGSPDAQMALADAYESAGQLESASKLRKCAYEQGHGPAAVFLGRVAKVDGDYVSAARYYQEGVQLGNEEAASILMLFFDIEYWRSHGADTVAKVRGLGFGPDPERRRRYRNIANILELNPDLRLKGLDKIVPLPPSKLPDWNGRIDEAIVPDARPPAY